MNDLQRLVELVRLVADDPDTHYRGRRALAAESSRKRTAALRAARRLALDAKQPPEGGRAASSEIAGRPLQAPDS